MADANVTFAAPGILQATREVRVLKNEVRGLGTQEVKVQAIRKKSAQEAVTQEGIIRRSVNRTTAAIGKQIAAFRARRAAAAAGGSGFLGAGGTGQRTGQALGRIGGAGGGIINAASEGLGIGGALGGVAIAAVAVGLALNSLTAASQRQEAIAAKIVQTNQQVLETQRSITRSAQSQALGFGQNSVQPFREIVSRVGGQGVIGEVERLRAAGVTNAADQFLQAIRTGVFDKLGTRRTGEIIQTGQRLGITPDFAQAANLGPRGLSRLQDSKQLENLLFGLGRGRTTGQALRDQSEFEQTGVGSRLSDIVNRQGAINAEIFEKFLGGSSNVALGERLAELREGEAVALARVTEALTKELEALEARADAEFDLVRRIKEVGRTIGLSEGSQAQLLGDLASARATVGTR